jgi:hypothetical protein
VASGLLSGDAEEGGGVLVLVVGGAQVRSTAVSSGAWWRPLGKREERREISVSIRLRWGKEGFGRLCGGIPFCGNGLRATSKQTLVVTNQ